MAETALSPYIKSIAASQDKFDSIVKHYGWQIGFASEARFAAQAIASNEELHGCRPASVVNALLSGATIGLSLDPALKHAYLVPYKSHCQFTPSYQGLVHLALTDGYLQWVQADVVYEGDKFELVKGTNPRCEHRPALRRKDRGKAIGAYCAWQTKDGTRLADWMDIDELEKVRSKSKMKSGAVWNEWTDEMRKKVVIKRSSKLWQKTERLSHQLALAHELDEGRNAKEISEPLNEEQVVELSAMIGGDKKLSGLLCEAYGVASPAELMQHQLADARKRIKSYQQAKNSKRAKK